MSSNPSKHRLLIVDDDRDTCANLADIFSDLGFEVDTAHDGFAALKLAECKTYDVAILDLKMPGMDGLELYRRLRKLSAGTVAVVVTAFASSETADEILNAGAWQLLSKPVDFSKLLNLVREAVDQPLVLIVDDDADLCESLWSIFREAGVRVYLSGDIDDAELRLGQRNYDAVIVDMKLPGGSGCDVVRCARELNPHARTVVVTGFRSEMGTGIDQAIADGAEAICYKPFDVGKLLDTVNKLVAKK